MIRRCAYRPFANRWLYHAGIVVDEAGTTGTFFPPAAKLTDNLQICFSSVGNSKPFQCLTTDIIADFHFMGDTKCFPLYNYALDGKLRRDNITDWALGQFQAKYGPDVTKRDIFHYVYGLLHAPEYRARYKENLKRELPRVPLVEPTPGASADPSLLRKGKDEEGKGEERGQKDQEYGLDGILLPSLNRGGSALAPGRGPFQQFAEAGAALAALHVGYEQAEEYPLTQTVNKDVPFSWRVTKMRLNKEKTAVVVNEALTLAGLPPEAFGYRLGNRSALEWVLDQYQVGMDKRSGIVSDPNRADDPEYIVRLVRRVVTVSVETVRLVAGLPPLHPPRT